ncbi:universal stress protein [Novacetimonas pomaceti]
MMRILAILDRPETAMFTLETAGGLADRMNGSEIRVLCPQPAGDPDFQSPDEGLPTHEEKARFARDISTRVEALHNAFDRWAASAGRSHGARWVEIAGDIRKVVAREAMTADMTVLSRPRSGDPDHVTLAFSAALYDAMAAVVVAPLQHHQTVGAHPVIAWHPAPNLERAMAAARPLLDGASRVTVIIGESRENEQPEPPFVDALRQRGIVVTVDRFIIASANVGEEIRTRALAAGGDLLVMGAYSRPHFIEWLFGGPTRDILAHGTLPILTHH